MDEMSGQGMEMPTLRVEMRFKNARLFGAIQEHARNDHASTRGQAMFNDVGVVNAFCRQNGFVNSVVYELLGFKRSPLSRGRIKSTDAKGVPWRPVCMKLAAVLERDVDWLFPLDLYDRELRPVALEGHHSQMLRLRDVPTNQLLLPASQDDAVLSRELRETMGAVLDDLSPRQAAVVRLRFGLEGGEEQSLRDVGRTLGLTSERVRQIENRALARLRMPGRARRLKGFVG